MGELMPSIIETLEQDEYWFGADARPYLITEMENSHRENTLRMLERKAADLYKHKVWYEAVYGDEDLFESSPQLPQDPIEWLLSTPCVQALRAAILRYRAEDGEVVPNADVIEGEVVSVEYEERKEIARPRHRSFS